MNSRSSPVVLTLNLGSSSVKFALFRPSGDEESSFDRLLSGKLNRIGLESSSFVAKDAGGAIVIEKHTELKSYRNALEMLLAWIESDVGGIKPGLTGHRLVHGGARYVDPQIVTPSLLYDLKNLVPLAPDHLPQEIDAIESVQRLRPDLQQALCFDTAFHRTMPRVARLYGLPLAMAEEGIIRYGFHGLSYESIVNQLAREAGEQVAHGRMIVAHLGNGSSLCAIREGRSIDTTMGFTPTSGLIMGTRSGDLDPSVVLYLIQHEHHSAADVHEILNKRAGLLGLSGTSSDMKELLAKIGSDPRAEEAVGVFCYEAKKFLGALVAALGGFETLVFTGGIGENSPPVRERVCTGLQDFGVRLDLDANSRNEAVISQPGARVTVRVIAADEEAMIAQHTLEVWRKT